MIPEVAYDLLSFQALFATQLRISYRLLSTLFFS